jgi:AP-3 complex subunit sigma
MFVLIGFVQINEDEQQNVIRKIFQQVAQRPDTFCNYLDGSVPEWGETTKIIYRHYATLYFIFAVDKQESDLGILDLIQVFVESLDKCFENVCELDLIFHSDRVNYILDEIIMAGMVLETNINNILTAVSEQNKLHATSLKSPVPTAMQPNSAAAQAKEIGGKLFSSISNSFKNAT